MSSRSSAYDGTYSGDATLAGGFGSAGKSVVFRLQLVNGRGSGSINAPSCNSSRFSVSVSPFGTLVGAGYLDCMVGGHTGPFKIDGNATKGALRVAFVFERGSTLRTRLTSVDVPSASASQDLAASTVQPRSTAYDGTYSADTYVLGISGSNARVDMSLQVKGGRGTGTLTSRGCNPSQFTVTISDQGTVSGEGYLNCVLGGTTPFTGPLKIVGNMEDFLAFQSDRGTGFRLKPNKGNTAAATTSSPAPLASPDGLWRGTYSCSALTAISTSGAGPFTLDVTMHIVDGSGSWKPSASRLDTTFEIKVFVSTTAVSVTRFHHDAGASVGGQSTLSGQYDGNTIRATGREITRAGHRGCTLSLARPT